MTRQWTDLPRVTLFDISYLSLSQSCYHQNDFKDTSKSQSQVKSRVQTMEWIDTSHIFSFDLASTSNLIPLSLHNLHQSSPSLITKPLLNIPTHTTTSLAVLLSQIRTNPSPHITHLRERIPWRRTTGIQRREADSKSYVLDVAVFDEVGVVGLW